MNIGQRIKQRRKELGLSADKLAEMLGKNRATVYRYENGEIENLPLDILKPIADALSTTPQHLMGWENVQKNNDAIADIVVRLRTDSDYLEVCSLLKGADTEQLVSIKQMLSVFIK